MGLVGTGNSAMARSFSGSGLIPSEEMMKPAKDTDCPQVYLRREMVMPASRHRRRTIRTLAKSSWSVRA